MPGQLTVSPKAVLKKLLHQGFCVRQGHQAISHVAGRNDAKIGAQPSRGATVISYRHHRCHVAGGLFDPTQENGQTVPAADDRHRRAAFQAALLVNEIYQAAGVFRH